jgi:hypothetical protein
MLLKQCLYGLTALAVALLVVTLFWLALIAAIEYRRVTDPKPAAPNPERFPIWRLSALDLPVYAPPWDVLVKVDPWFDGRGAEWIVPGAALLAGLMFWAMGFPVLRKGNALAPDCPRLRRVLLASLVVGFILAAPWVYAAAYVLCRVPSPDT